MRQTTKFYAVLLCAALGFSTSIQSCKDYDDDIDSLNERIDAVSKSLEDLKKDFGALAYVKDVKWDEATRTLTITPATGNPVTYNISDADTKDGNTKYTLVSAQAGNKITITLKGDDNSEQKVEFELPSVETITKDDITLEDGYICIKGDKTNVKMPQDFDFTKMQVENKEGALYLKYGDQEIKLLDVNVFDPEALTFVSENGKIVVKYLGTPTGQTIELPAATAIIEKEDGSGFIIKVGDQQVDIVNLNILKAELKSLVFIPEVYYQGIEAMYAQSFYYTPWTLEKADADKKEVDKDPVKGTKEFSVTPKLKAQYHLNPSNAKVSKENLSFIFDNKPYTKADGMDIDIIDAETTDGVLTVLAGLSNGTIKDIENDKEVSTLALQVITAKGAKDTTITSDYAAIKAVAVKDFVLAEPTDEELTKDKHHFTTAQTAIDNNDKVYPLVWNNDKGIDVAKLVQTHVGKDDLHKALDKDASTGEMKAYGFKYNYELVGYISGENKTSQSAHAAMKGSILRAQTTKDGKQQNYGAAQSRSTIGRMPLVRVSLIDTATNNVAAVAYLKFKITDEEEVAPVDKVLYVAKFEFDSTYTVSCNTEAYNFDLLWNDVEEGIYTALSMSKEDFEKDFKLDVDASQYLKQYNDTTINAKEVATRFGNVVQKADEGGQMTNVLEWTVSQDEAYKKFTSDKVKASVSVRFAKENTNGTHSYVYVQLTWAPKVYNINPNGTIANSNKLPEVWFKHNTNDDGFDDVQIGVAVPTTAEGSGTCTFTNDLLQKFSKEQIIISGIEAVYKDFTDDKLTKSFYFVSEANKEVKGSDGKTYVLTVNADGKELIATEKGNALNKATVAKLSDADPVKVHNSVVTYEQNTIALAILNYAAGIKDTKSYLENVLTVQVGIKAVNGCNKPIALTNNTFCVKFMPPVTITAKDNKGLEDGVAGGSEIAIADILSFVDWRQQAFTASNGLFKYYGVNAVDIDIDAIKISDGRLLTEEYPGVTIAYEKAKNELSLADLGKLTWHNNQGTVVKNMTLLVPVQITYTWGTIVKDIEVNVKKTQGNVN